MGGGRWETHQNGLRGRENPPANGGLTLCLYSGVPYMKKKLWQGLQLIISCGKQNSRPPIGDGL